MINYEVYIYCLYTLQCEHDKWKHSITMCRLHMFKFCFFGQPINIVILYDGAKERKIRITKLQFLSVSLSHSAHSQRVRVRSPSANTKLTVHNSHAIVICVLFFIGVSYAQMKGVSIPRLFNIYYLLLY